MSGQQQQQPTAADIARGIRGIVDRIDAPRKPSTRTTLVRALTAMFIGKVRMADAREIASDAYGRFPAVLDALENPGKFLRRSAINPATTFTPTWAAELVTSSTLGAIPVLSPSSVFALLSARGLRVDLGRDRSITLPRRATPPAASTPFVGEGAAIPVRRLDLSGSTLRPYGAKLISIYSTELAENSAPSIESVLRVGLGEDVALGIDSVLLGTAAGSTIQPPGLRNGVAGLTPSAATGAQAVAEDLAALANAISPSPADLVFVMGSAQQVAAASLGNFAGQIITTDVLPASTVMAIDASDLATTESDDPEFSITTDATIVNDDGTPVPPFATTSTISLYQQDLIGIRVVEFLGWAMRRPGRVAWMTGVAW